MHSRRTIRLEVLATVVVLVTACSFSEFRESPNGGMDKKGPLDRPVNRVVTEEPASAAAIPVPPDQAPVSNLWRHLASEFTWDTPDRPDVQEELYFFTKHRRHVELLSRNADPYLGFIVDELEQRGLPFELALLPLIESGYQAGIVSPGGAAGLWQFTPETGRRFGLKQSRGFDGRRDIVASTNAALDYLSQLYATFDGDWLLAMAAYNCGQQRVQRALGNSASQEFWAIAPELPSGTRRHIAKLLAAVAVFRSPSTYDISLYPIDDSQRFAEIDLNGSVEMSTIVDAGLWSEKSFKQFNPAFSGSGTDPNGPIKILVPPELKAPIVDYLASSPPTKRYPIKTHRVVANETLSDIASRYGASVQTIKARNKLQGDLIRVGNELVITGPLDAKPGPGKQLVAWPNGHVVQKGDSLWTIGRQYGSTPAALARLNGMSVNSPLQIGQVLKIVARGNIQKI